MLLQSCKHTLLTVLFHLLKVPNSFTAPFWPSVYPFLYVTYILSEKLPNICHMQRETVNSLVFETFYRNMGKWILKGNLNSIVRVLPLLEAKRGK